MATVIEELRAFEENQEKKLKKAKDDLAITIEKSRKGLEESIKAQEALLLEEKEKAVVDTKAKAKKEAEKIVKTYKEKIKKLERSSSKNFDKAVKKVFSSLLKNV